MNKIGIQWWFIKMTHCWAILENLPWSFSWRTLSYSSRIDSSLCRRSDSTMLATYAIKKLVLSRRTATLVINELTFLRVNLNSVSGFEKSLFFVESGLLHRCVVGNSSEIISTLPYRTLQVKKETFQFRWWLTTEPNWTTWFFNMIPNAFENSGWMVR